jgi:hypothetical protein
MADNFDLKKFLKESKALENLNPTLKSLNENNHVKDKIREMIIAELDSAGDITIDSAPKKDLYDIYEGDPENEDEDNYDYSNDFYDGDPNEDGDPNDFGDTDEFDGYGGFDEGEEINNKRPIMVNTKKIDVGEAKKKDEEVEDVETTDVETTDTTEEVPAEETPEASGGLEDIAADMEGTEGDLMDSLMKALKIAKGMNNEKLETQIGNTLKFFVSEYIGGDKE